MMHHSRHVYPVHMHEQLQNQSVCACVHASVRMCVCVCVCVLVLVDLDVVLWQVCKPKHCLPSPAARVTGYLLL